MAKALKVGFIGAGGIAGTHITYLKGIEDVEVYAVCDIREDAVKKTAEKFSVPKVFSSYRELLKLKEIDAVSVCTPNHLHAEHAMASLRAGKHTMVEKPMAMNVRQAERMLKTAEERKRVLVVGFQYRFHPNAQMLKRAVGDGLLGRILYARSQALRRRGIPNWGVFGQKKFSGGGPLIDIGVHILEVTHYVMGKPKPVSASGQCFTYIGNKKPEALSRWGEWDYRSYDVEDLAVGFIRFEDGSTLVIESSFAAHIEQDSFNFTVMGEKGGGNFQPPMLFTDLSGTMFNLSAVYTGEARAFEVKMRDWIDAVRGKKQPESPAEDGLVVQKMLDGIYRSSELGREVSIK